MGTNFPTRWADSAQPRIQTPDRPVARRHVSGRNTITARDDRLRRAIRHPSFAMGRCGRVIDAFSASRIERQVLSRLRGLSANLGKVERLAEQPGHSVALPAGQDGIDPLDRPVVEVGHPGATGTSPAPCRAVSAGSSPSSPAAAAFSVSRSCRYAPSSSSRTAWICAICSSSRRSAGRRRAGPGQPGLRPGVRSGGAGPVGRRRGPWRWLLLARAALSAGRSASTPPGHLGVCRGRARWPSD